MAQKTHPIPESRQETLATYLYSVAFATEEKNGCKGFQQVVHSIFHVVSVRDLGVD